MISASAVTKMSQYNVFVESTNVTLCRHILHLNQEMFLNIGRHFTENIDEYENNKGEKLKFTKINS